jgi:putative transposase
MDGAAPGNASSGQLAFVFRPRGGVRKGAGRKARADRKDFLPHVPRERHTASVPVHITARAVKASPNLRSERIFNALRAVFAKASEKRFGLLHFSVQGNHVHLIVEGDNNEALARGVQRLLSRIAMIVNAVSRRSGRLWRDRHHRHPLHTPSEMRNAYVYVLFNFRKHRCPGGQDLELALTCYDPCSSFAWFDGWQPSARPSAASIARAGPPIVERAHSWLAHTGWRDRGLIGMKEMPRG